MKLSAGILMYKFEQGRLEVLLVHPGGPLFAKRDEGWWSIPKGEYGEQEDPVDAAIRELQEETGASVAASDLAALGEVRQRGGKLVSAWCVEQDFDVSKLVSNTFAMEWPPRSGVMREFPEIDRAEWFSPQQAREKLNPAQAEFIDRLELLLEPGIQQGRGRNQ